ncbi:DUF6691 family protein [Azospirillum sp.]|uniref:DUF6691 family protein n=1 Tax=Azospirillum sp. TaxID=34012 RepID=UPI002D65FBD9|nr:DUF6691 family protein [Azospirillum sp.]HYD67206.1 DUF6691 family protein [Azospirillum sp.]
MGIVISAFAAGLLFGLGLLVSGMADPAKVLAFLDLSGNWDPSLAFVMGGAVAVSALGYRLAVGRGAAVLDGPLKLPERRDLDGRLIGGSALFGVGWGLVGLCPGPAIVGLALGTKPVLVFVAAMLAGMAAYRLIGHLFAQPRHSFAD